MLKHPHRFTVRSEDRFKCQPLFIIQSAQLKSVLCLLCNHNSKDQRIWFYLYHHGIYPFLFTKAIVTCRLLPNIIYSFLWIRLWLQRLFFSSFIFLKLSWETDLFLLSEIGSFMFLAVGPFVVSLNIFFTRSSY